MALDAPQRATQRWLLCSHLLRGLKRGVSGYTQPSRVAVLVCERPGDPLCVYDPEGLLREYRVRERHGPLLASLLGSACESWPENRRRFSRAAGAGHNLMGGDEVELLASEGLVFFARLSGSVVFQLWIAEVHPEYETITQRVVQEWLRMAAWSLTAELFSDDDLGSIGSFRAADSLTVFAPGAIGGALGRLRGTDPGSPDYIHWPGCIEALRKVSQAVEEGEGASGQLMFSPAREREDLVWLARFPEQGAPRTTNPKHVVKLLQAVSSEPSTYLVLDEERVLGIARLPGGDPRLETRFVRGVGDVIASGVPVCSVSRGAFRAHLDRSALLRRILGTIAGVPVPVLSGIAGILEAASVGNYGCVVAFVPDLSDRPLCAHWFQDPISLPALTQEGPSSIDVIAGMAKVDGALLIDRTASLCAFGAILDGVDCGHEDPSRGARYNSSMRFSARHPEAIVVAQSQDGPVAIFYQGRPVLDVRAEVDHPLEPTDLREESWSIAELEGR